MSTAPLPSQLVFLTDLPSLKERSKVRFLGCVTKYSSATGILHLEHAYPASTVKDNRSVTALVDVDLLIGNLKATNVQAGEWVNVIGYVQGDTSDGNKDGMQAGNKVVVEVKVQAMMLWSAGQVELREYEKSVRKRNEIHMLR